MSYYTSVLLDSTLNPLEEARFLRRVQKFAKRIQESVHFTMNELQSLLIIYYKLQKEGGFDPKGVTKEQYIEVLYKGLNMTDGNIVNKIVTVLDKKSREYYVSMETWVTSMSLFLRGTLEEKIRFCFTVYDVKGCGLLGKEALFRFLKRSIHSTGGEQDDEEAVKDMVDVIVKKLDLDRDGKISFNDYRSTVLRQPCWLEFLGPCLPDRISAYKFLTTMTKTGKET